MKNLIWICVAIICVNCDSGTGSNDSNETNTNALSVGDAFSGFENLSICANDNIFTLVLVLKLQFYFFVLF